MPRALSGLMMLSGARHWLFSQPPRSRVSKLSSQLKIVKFDAEYPQPIGCIPLVSHRAIDTNRLTDLLMPFYHRCS
ncbi:hypothetical protein GGI35DRAFT_458091 [Trichoderma velutinum]